MEGWKERAREARNKLRHAKHGEREAVLRELSGDNDPNTLRRAIFALGYLDDLKKTNPSVWESLEDVSLSLTELLARWNSFDPKGATEAAVKVTAGHYTVVDLVKDLQAAKIGVSAKSESLPYREQIKSTARQAVEEILGGNISLPEIGIKESDDDRPLDFKFLRTEGQPPKFETVAGLIVGPYQSESLYRKRRHDWLERSLGLAWFYDHVFIFLPLASEIKSYQEWIKRAQERSKQVELNNLAQESPRRVPSVHVVHPKLDEPPELTEEQAASLREIGGT
jgi:hypothetical protein